MGMLTIDGTLDIDQFWPHGTSDADTSKIIVDVAPGSIRYQPPEESARPTTKFDGAFVKSYGSKKLVIKNNKLTVRLQGIDAPELHYQPQSMKGIKYKGADLGSLAGSGLVKQYRQHQAERATSVLGQYLGSLGSSPLSCRFVTQVDDEQGPAHAIDKYGRFVGNILVNGTDVNLEILRQGLSVVALYNSMRNDEMQECVNAWNIGRTASRSVLQYLTSMIGTFDSTLLIRDGAAAALDPDGARKFIHPKLYRRQCTWWAYRKVGKFPSGFDTFLKLSKQDVFYELADFVGNGRDAAVQIPMEKMVKDGTKVVYGPDEVVFKEAPSTLYGPDGKKVDQW
jgi:endonuclease YncB( thermonuclease family)